MEQRPPGDRGIVTLRVQGWMLPEPTAAGSSEQPPAVYLSDLLVKARVLLNKELFGEESTVTWDPSQVDLAADGFQFSRPAKQSFDAKIELHLVPWSDTAKRTATQKLESLTAMRRVGKLLPVRARRAPTRITIRSQCAMATHPCSASSDCEAGLRRPADHSRGSVGLHACDGPHADGRREKLHLLQRGAEAHLR
eukprot:COSAG01_NODE_4122_length_5331_cov_11.476873_3_plen_195_part_00